jgi:glutamyl-tRNA reductase
MEGLSKALSEIGDCILLAIEHAKLVNTAEMREAVSQLYAAIFHFLREAMLWYKAKRLSRLVKSFDQNLYDKVSDIIDQIKQRADQIHKRGIIAHHAKTTDNIYTTKHIDKKLDHLIQNNKEDRKIFRELHMSQAIHHASDMRWLGTSMQGDTQITRKAATLHISALYSLLTVAREL